jgi:hypothetical protein
MNIAFTICSNNYLAQATVWAESLIAHSQDCIPFIGLCDERSDDIDYSNFPCELIDSDQIGIENFDELWKKYNIVELNTSVKASFFKYLIQKFPEATFIYYFDPDTKIFASLFVFDAKFGHEFDVLLTPHIIKPLILDEKCPGENMFLNNGIYNLGFLGLRVNSAIVGEFLKWWEERTLKIGFDDVKRGLFVDQLWLNLVPIYFDRVKILKEMGFNAAPWNIHERLNISKKDNAVYVMPDGSDLIFYHFSNYKYSIPEVLSSSYNRVKFCDSAVVREMYSNYYKQLIKNGISHFSTIQCMYTIRRRNWFDSNNKNNINIKNLKKVLKNIIPPIFIKLYWWATRLLKNVTK